MSKSDPGMVLEGLGLPAFSVAHVASIEARPAMRRAPIEVRLLQERQMNDVLVSINRILLGPSALTAH